MKPLLSYPFLRLSVTAVTAAVDGAFMLLYAGAKRNMRLISRLALVLVPLMVLLVGSCKTSELSGAYGIETGPVQIRTAFFPDRVNFTGMEYYPAEGYIARAQKYVRAAPATLTLLSEDEIEYLFGIPGMRRSDADARIWQYEGKYCVVDFYFYGGTSTTAADVSHVDIREKTNATDLNTRGQKKCLGQIIRSGEFSSQRI